MILALAGGVGGAKLAQGLAMLREPDDLTIVVNTGDDFTHLGFNISPDVDTVMYWLSGLNDRTRGWGLADETWQFMEGLKALGGPTWFNLGDRDLATHVERTRRLRSGQSLSEVTTHLCRQLAIRHRVVPMTDAAVATVVHTDEGVLSFQDYFVHRQCEPRVSKIEYGGASDARPSPAFADMLTAAHLDAIVICPSNPLLSIEPILSLDGVRKRIEGLNAPIVAVSPIVGNQAIKGPAAKILRELGRDASALEIARHYDGLIDGLVIDETDRALTPAIEALGIAVRTTASVMKTAQDQRRLADETLRFAASLSG